VCDDVQTIGSELRIVMIVARQAHAVLPIAGCI